MRKKKVEISQETKSRSTILQEKEKDNMDLFRQKEEKTRNEEEEN